MSSKVIGEPIQRVGGVDRVTGKQCYVGDIKLSGMLHCKIVHIDCAHARILSIDTKPAFEVEGVRAVVTGKDLPQPVRRFGPMFQDRPILAVNEVKYHGEAIAVVVAECEHAASIAASRVIVDYEELPTVLTVSEALASDAELVQDPYLRPDGPFKQTNIINELKFGWGDVDSCRADEIIENTYVFPMMTQFAIEPFCFLSAPEEDGLVVYSANQNPYMLQKVMAELFDLSISKVRVIAPDPGGAFGGKQHAKFEPILAHLALKLGRPVRLELTLEESFQAVRRTGAEVRIKSGFSSDGTLVFQDIEANYLMGAYVDIAARVVAK